MARSSLAGLIDSAAGGAGCLGCAVGGPATGTNETANKASGPSWQNSTAAAGVIADTIAAVRHADGKDLEEPLIVRPTSEARR
jgi:hypothetical protein